MLCNEGESNQWELSLFPFLQTPFRHQQWTPVRDYLYYASNEIGSMSVLTTASSIQSGQLSTVTLPSTPVAVPSSQTGKCGRVRIHSMLSVTRCAHSKWRTAHRRLLVLITFVSSLSSGRCLILSWWDRAWSDRSNSTGFHRRGSRLSESSQQNSRNNKKSLFRR